jgi:hypothetical protein
MNMALVRPAPILMSRPNSSDNTLHLRLQVAIKAALVLGSVPEEISLDHLEMFRR